MRLLPTSPCSTNPLQTVIRAGGWTIMDYIFCINSQAFVATITSGSALGSSKGLMMCSFAFAGDFECTLSNNRFPVSDELAPCYVQSGSTPLNCLRQNMTVFAKLTPIESSLASLTSRLRHAGAAGTLSMYMPTFGQSGAYTTRLCSASIS